MTIWLTSDQHFGHENIIRYSKRPFRNAAEMDEALIDNWNAVVKPEDHVYNLGDVTMQRDTAHREWLSRLIHRLNGHKRLLLGNHDHYPVEVYLQAGFEKVRGTGQWFGGVLLSHYPIHPTSFGRAALCVHGHIHTNPSPPPFTTPEGFVKSYRNVCVEVTNYTPISLDELLVR